MNLLSPVLAVTLLLSATTLQSADFSFTPPGVLSPNTSGKGYTGNEIFFPHMRFPLEAAPAFLNSQVYGPGGNHGPNGGSQCDPSNYAYPWHDNFCESRSWSMPMCPTGKGHQGQDIRPSSCKKDVYWAVATEDGVIAHIGSYSVTLQTKDGVLYRYLHLNMSRLAVGLLEKVHKGQKIGLVSNHFGGSSTTTHLHFDVKASLSVKGKPSAVFVPPYTSLIESYRNLIGGAR